MLPELRTGPLRMPLALNFLDLAEPRLTDNLKQNGDTLIKFISTLGEFLQKSAAVYEQYGEELRSLAQQGRQQLQKLSNDGDYLIPSLLKLWDQMLNYTAVSGEESIDMANKLSSDITIRMMNSTSHRKIQTQKLFEERSTLESMVNQTEEQFYQHKRIGGGNRRHHRHVTLDPDDPLKFGALAQKDYVQAYSNFLLSNGDKAIESQTKSRYLNAHNGYVLQLHRYNSVMEDYQGNILPQWFQEVENMYTDVYSVLCTAIIDLNQRQGIKTVNESKRCEELIQMAKQIDSKTDLILFARGLDPVTSPGGVRGKRFEFQPPAHSAQDGPKDEIVNDNLTSKNMRSVMDSLMAEEANLENQLKRQYQLLNDLMTTQQKHMEMHLYSKVTGIQEDISEARKAIRTTKIKLSGLHGQLSVLDTRYASSRRASVAYTSPIELPESITQPGMKTKWKKAFFNLKRNGTLKHKDSMERIPQEYTGGGSDSKLRPGQKSPRLRRNIFQRDQSASELNITGLKLNGTTDARTAIGNGSPMDIDPVYLLLKQGATLNPSKRDGTDSGFGSDRRLSKASNETLPSLAGGTNAGSVSSSGRRLIDRRNSSMSEPESAITTSTVRPMLSARMKSVSLDSSEKSDLQQELIQGRVGRPVLERGSSTVGPLQGAPSPSSKRRLLLTKSRVKSLDLGDGPSDGPSEPPSRHERHLPQNVFVALQSYRCKGPDELELRPGDKVLVTDSSQPDWWKGKCFSNQGYFPRDRVARVNPGEKVCVVTHSLQLNENGTVLRLSKDDIVMTTGKDDAGMVPIRCGGKRASCPLKYLQELGYFEV